MTPEETLQQELTGRFPALAGRVRVQRIRRVWAEATPETFRGIIEYAAAKLNFKHLCTITGLDDGETLGIVYHLSRSDGMVLCLKNSVPKSAPVLQTITDLFAGGISYERELVDMLGAQVQGLPPGNRYPLPEDWPAGQYPLRKDWKSEVLDKPQAAGKGEGAHG